MSVDIKTGAHNDLVLYDQSHKIIELGEGDDTLIPTKAAYSPVIEFGSNIVNAMRNDSYWYGGPTFGGYWEGAGAPFKTKAYGDRKFEYSNNIAAPSKNSSNKSSTTTALNPYLNSNIWNGFDSSVVRKTEVFDASYYRDPLAKESIESFSIEVGGFSAYGQSGNDIIYGLDPLLYNSSDGAKEVASSNKANGTLRLKFLNAAKTDINWSPILLSGGEGQDTFMIGDLSKINSEKTYGSTYYTILGDKNSIDETEFDKKVKSSWGNNFYADAYYLTASYGYTEEVIQKGINLDYSTKGNPDWAGNAQIGTKTAKFAIASAKAIGTKVPFIDAGLAAINLGIEVVKAFQKNKPPRTNKFYQEELKQKVVPPGSWNQTITIPDWDPLDRFVIQTIPAEDPKKDVKQDNQWKNVNFKINFENNQAMAPQTFGVKIQMETAVDQDKNIAYLPGLQPPTIEADFGYRTYNFFTGRHQKIDPIKHFTYFGVLANTEEVNKIKTSYVEKSFAQPLTISKESSVFLWNSGALHALGLRDQYRAGASSIQIGVDTRQFGWFTDLKLDSSGKTIDKSSSTFNYWDSDAKSWASMSFEEFAQASSETQNDLSDKMRYTYWTAQDTEANKLMNLSAADAANSNDVEFYKTRDDGSVLDPVTGEWLAPSNSGYEQAALSEANYAGALSVQESEDGSTKLIVDDGYKLAPFIETTFADGRVDHIFAFDDVHANDPEHTRVSMVQIDDTGVIRFEDVIGGDYDYNDAVLDPTLYPELAALLASSLFN